MERQGSRVRGFQGSRVNQKDIKGLITELRGKGGQGVKGSREKDKPQRHRGTEKDLEKRRE